MDPSNHSRTNLGAVGIMDVLGNVGTHTIWYMGALDEKGAGYRVGLLSSPLSVVIIVMNHC